MSFFTCRVFLLTLCSKRRMGFVWHMPILTATILMVGGSERMDDSAFAV